MTKQWIRLEGLIPVTEDWHARMNIMKVIKNIYIVQLI